MQAQILMRLLDCTKIVSFGIFYRKFYNLKIQKVV